MIRRDFLKNAGFLAIGFSIARPVAAALAREFAGDELIAGKAGTDSGFYAEQLPGSLRRFPAIDSWLRINSNGRVTVLTGKMELGQGIRTAMAQVAADELDLAMEKIDIVLAATGITPDEGYTAGSGSMDNSAMSVRYAAAAAREKLLALAATALNVTVDTLQMRDGLIISSAGGKQISFEKLLDGKQITDRVSLPVKLKPKDQYKFVGKAIRRDDISKMVKGNAMYVQDMRFPGMLHARIIRPPDYAATLKKIDEPSLKKDFPSLQKIVVDGNFIGVISSDEYTVVQVQQRSDNYCEWNMTVPLRKDSDKELKEYLLALPFKTQNVKNKGSISISPDLSDKEHEHKARYFKPYTMHGSVGPSCSIAIYKDDLLEIWSHSQGVYPLRTALAKLIGFNEEKIRINGVPGSGCYGHNGADDVSAEAAILAIANPGKHIRLQWSRADEHCWEPYGSAMIIDIAAKLDAAGRITDWKTELWSDTHGTRPGGNAENLLPSRYIRKSVPRKPGGFSGGAHRNSEPYYTIQNIHIDFNFFEGPLRVSALRSLGAYGNIFAIESFIDELAEKAGKNPFDFRIMHLDDPRAIAVLQKLRSIIPADNPSAKTGIAFSRYKNTASYCAVAATVTKNKTGDISILKMFSVIDAGESINLDGVINQTEGGMIQAASWTMQEEVKFSSTEIRSVDWRSYPIFRFSQVPETEVVVINNPEEGPMGAGEAAQGPAGAAVANAVFRLIGKRHRDLPIAPIIS